MELQSSQLLTSVLQNMPVQLEPGLLASLSSGRLQILQLESTLLPAQVLDWQMTKTKLTPWQDGDQSSVSETSTEEESEFNDEPANPKDETGKLSGKNMTKQVMDRRMPTNGWEKSSLLPMNWMLRTSYPPPGCGLYSTLTPRWCRTSLGWKNLPNLPQQW